METTKVYVEVTARFAKEGSMIPLKITWEDGKEFSIDKVKTKERVTDYKSGSVATRFTVIVAGKECHLFFEGNKWFVERKTA